MAINLLAQYPGKVGATSSQWPFGEPRNVTVPGDGLGTPWEVALAKDIIGLQQALLKSAAIVPSGTPEQVGASEYLQALVELSSGRAVKYTTGGTGANAITLTPLANQQGPASYFNGLKATFTATSNNTAGMTFNIAGLGIKTALHGETGLALIGGDIVSGTSYDLEYNGTNILVKRNAQVYSNNFTPRLVSESGTTETGSYNGTFIGSYSVIGDFVFVSMRIDISGVTGDVTNPLKVRGLPFDVGVNPLPHTSYTFDFGHKNALMLGSASFSPVGLAGSLDDRIDLVFNDIVTSSVAATPMTSTHINSSGTLSISGFYKKVT